MISTPTTRWVKVVAMSESRDSVTLTEREQQLAIDLDDAVEAALDDGVDHESVVMALYALIDVVNEEKRKKTGHYAGDDHE